MNSAMNTTVSLPEDEDPILQCVQLDGLVVLKIVQHCKENLPIPVTGQLVGLDVDSALEVTNCFPIPIKVSSEGDDEKEEGIIGKEYQIEMLRCLREVNIDHNTVGWYSSTIMGEFINQETIQTQFNYQDIVKKSVMLFYDQLKTSQGTLSLKAFRLTQTFMELYRTQNFSKEGIVKNGFLFREIFEEIPIRLSNTKLIDAFLVNLEDSSNRFLPNSTVSETRFSPILPISAGRFEQLSLSNNPFLEKHLEFFSDCLDDLLEQQGKFQNYQKSVQKQQTLLNAWLAKTKLENAQRKAAGLELLPEEIPPTFKLPPEPSRLESLLISNQIGSYCEQVKQYAVSVSAKLWLAKGFQREQ